MAEPSKSYFLRDKAEQFIGELYQSLRRYPKSERHVLAAETRQSAYRLLRFVLGAGKTRNKARSLELADNELAMVFSLMRIGMQLQYLPFPHYERLSRQAEEIGKLIGSWLKKV